MHTGVPLSQTGVSLPPTWKTGDAQKRDALGHLNATQVDYILQLKRDDYQQSVRTARYLCDEKIRAGVCRGKMPVRFKISNKMLKKEFSRDSFVSDLVRSLEQDGFYAQLKDEEPNVLLVYPKGAVTCTFLKMSDNAMTFVQRMKAAELSKQQRGGVTQTSSANRRVGGVI